MGGIEAYERIRDAGSRIATIFMTGYSAATVQSKFATTSEFFEDIGAVVLQKPYSVESLGHKVREVLDQLPANGNQLEH